MWDWFINLLSQIITWLAGVCGDYGLAVILLTLIIRVLLTPLTIRSTKSSAQMQVLQPKMREIQERYKDDPQRMQEETTRLYSENKINPVGGCLPLLLQMPVFFALFAVLKNLPAEAHFYGILDSLAQSFSGAVGQFGWAGAWVYLILDVAFGALTFLPLWMNARATDESQRQQSLVMGVVMALMMMWFGWGVPVGVLLYYVTSAAFGVIQQQFITKKVLEEAKQDLDAKMNGAPQIDVVRKERKARPHKKTK